METPHTTKKYSMADIRHANKEAGKLFFSRNNMKFAQSKIESAPYQGHGGIYFITSECFTPDSDPGRREYRVRQFNPETGGISTPYSGLTALDIAREHARRLAKGGM